MTEDQARQTLARHGAPGGYVAQRADGGWYFVPRLGVPVTAPLAWVVADNGFIRAVTTIEQRFSQVLAELAASGGAPPPERPGEPAPPRSAGV